MTGARLGRHDFLKIASHVNLVSRLYANYRSLATFRQLYSRASVDITLYSTWCKWRNVKCCNIFNVPSHKEHERFGIYLELVLFGTGMISTKQLKSKAFKAVDIKWICAHLTYPIKYWDKQFNKLTKCFLTNFVVFNCYTHKIILYSEYNWFSHCTNL